MEKGLPSISRLLLTTERRGRTWGDVLGGKSCSANKAVQETCLRDTGGSAGSTTADSSPPITSPASLVLLPRQAREIVVIPAAHKRKR